MIQKASEVLRDALRLSQINDSQAFDWNRKISLFNTNFAEVWDILAGYEDDFLLRQIELRNGEDLPRDLYALRKVYNSRTREELKRSPDFNDKPSRQYYSVINNTFYCDNHVTATVTYSFAPPVVTFPNDVISFERGDFKLKKDLLVKRDMFNFTTESLIDGSTSLFVLEIPLSLQAWDICNGYIVTLGVNPTSGAAELYLNDTLVAQNVTDFVVDNNQLQFARDGLFFDVSSSLKVTQRRFPLGYEYGEELFNLYTDPVTGNSYVQFYNRVEEEWETLMTVLDAYFCSPYIVYQNNDGWFLKQWGVDSDDVFITKDDIIGADWSNETGYGVLVDYMDRTELHSIYPDTRLDYPNTMYFDYLEAALAVEMRQQIELPVFEHEKIKEDKRLLVAQFINRNRANAYRMSNPYSVR